MVRIVTTEPIGDNALTVYYKTADGKLLERMLSAPTRPTFRSPKRGAMGLRCTGRRLQARRRSLSPILAHLFDLMMAVHTSNVEPLPHQITAVYERCCRASCCDTSPPTTPARARPSAGCSSANS